MLFGGVPILTLHVGPDQLAFHVHQSILFDASPVLKAAFSGSFKEAAEKSMSLPDDDKDAVECMIQSIYTKKLRLTTTVSKDTSHLCYMELAKLNALAEKYDICSLRNDIIDEFFKFSELDLPPDIGSITYVYNTTSERSSLRKLLVAWYAYNIDFGWFQEDTTKDELAKVSPDFAIGLAIELGLRQGNRYRESLFDQPSKELHESSPNKPDK